MMQLLISGLHMPAVSWQATVHDDVSSGKLAEKRGAANIVPWSVVLSIGIGPAVPWVPTDKRDPSAASTNGAARTPST